MRFEGLKLLRDLLGDSQVGYELNGGYEVFLNENKIFEESLDALGKVNLLLKMYLIKTFEIKKNSFGFKGIKDELIYNTLEGQIDTGLMIQSLLKLVHKENSYTKQF